MNSIRIRVISLLSALIFSLLLVMLMGLGCQGLDDGLYPADLSGEGPSVIFDFDAKPFAEIPFPNNLATIMDETSPTGRRLNVSLLAPTVFEGELREKVDKLDGFGTFQPVTLRFDGPLDLDNIVERHHDPNLAAANDAVYLVNVDPNSPKYGTAVPLDIGQGNFPVVLEPILGDPYTQPRNLCAEYVDEHDLMPEKEPVEGEEEEPAEELAEDEVPSNINTELKTTGYFNHCDLEWRNTVADPHLFGSNLVLESRNEDTNGNGKLDPGEDIDSDGVLDKPNTLPEDGDPWRDLIYFYEKETDTLIMRPILALEERTTYAVVVTKRLTGTNGDHVRSPFHSINHLKQSWELDPLLDVLSTGFTMEGDSSQSPISLDISEVSFTWSFTTQTITKDLIAIRKGMWGQGPLSWLNKQYPAELKQIDRLTLLEEDDKDTQFDERNQYLLPVGNLQEILGIAGVLLLSEIIDPEYAQESVNFMMETLDSVDYIVSGRYTTPYFLADQDGIGTEGYAADNDESFKIDLDKGEAHVGEDEVTWWCAIPKQTEYAQQPFPVSLYSHGYSGNRFETIGFASLMARYGIATCGIDAVGHGMIIPDHFLHDPIVEILLDSLKVRPTLYSISTGRARDLNNDGMPDCGGDFWTADTFHTRDIVRQTVIDSMQFLRILRGFDGERTWGPEVYQDDAEYFHKGKPSEIAGDFDGDGIPDLGGPMQDYFPWGQSLGGFVTTLLSAVEPAATATAPVAGGAGLIDVGLRTTQEGVIQAVFLSFMGPFVYAQPVPGTDQLSFGFLVPGNTRWWGTNDGVHEHFIRDFARSSEEMENPPEAGDKVVVINEISGDEFSCILNQDLVCRVGFAADAKDATEIRHHLGLDDEYYFRGLKEIIEPRDGEVKFYEPSEEEVAAWDDETKRLFDLRSQVVWIPEAEEVGDLIRVELRGADGTVKDVIARWGQNTGATEGQTYAGNFYNGFFYRIGDELVSPAEGLGKRRQSPEFRRLMAISSMILEPADPAPWVRHVFERPLAETEFSDIPEDAALFKFRKSREAKGWVPHTNLLAVPTNGDMQVPVSTEISLPRTAGMIELYKTRPEWDGMLCQGGSYSENDMLLRSKSVEVVAALKYFDNACFEDDRELNFDPDDLDSGTDDIGAPTVPGRPLRATVVSRPWAANESTADRRPDFEGDEETLQGIYRDEMGISAMRIPYLNMGGTHGFATPSPFKQYDIEQHMFNMIGRYFQSHGKELWDLPCLSDSSCDYFNEKKYAAPPE